MSGSSPSMGAALGGRLPLVHARGIDRVKLALGAVFILSAAFYLWIAGLSVPLSLHDGLSDRYNLLATAFLHFRLSVGPAPAALLRFADPYSPRAIATLPSPLNDATSLNDDAMYNGQLYFIWGPAPALVLLVPLHLLGFEPSPSVTDSFYGIAGVGFALASLRVIIKQIGEQLPIWMCVLAGFALSLSSVVPFLMRTPSITMETLAGGYCFAMAGIWLALSAIASRHASLTRLALMSLCFGLAANSRPTLWLTAVVLVPVYLALRRSRSRRSLLTALALPIGICLLAFLAYNQARFHNPLEIGSHYQLTGYESRTAPLGRLSYVLPGLGFYAFTPPRLEVLFPFIHLVAPTASGPATLAAPEVTGGLLPMAPIVVLVLALPWLWRRRPARLGPLAPVLLVIACVGAAIPILPSYQFFASTERYETDFATLLLLGGLAAWLSLASGKPGYRRRLLRIGGGVLVAWGCVTGFAISFYGSDPELAITHRGTWHTLEDIGSPLSTAIAAVVGHPVVAAIYAAHEEIPPVSYSNVGSSVTAFSLSVREHASITVVSPGAGEGGLLAEVTLRPGTSYEVRLESPGAPTTGYRLNGDSSVAIPLRLKRGLNHLTLHPVATSKTDPAAGAEAVLISDLSVTEGNVG